jgi:hypothetical protein
LESRPDYRGGFFIVEPHSSVVDRHSLVVDLHSFVSITLSASRNFGRRVFTHPDKQQKKPASIKKQGHFYFRNF